MRVDRPRRAVRTSTQRLDAPPERVLPLLRPKVAVPIHWGTYWPHPNLRSLMPVVVKLVDVIPRLAPSAELKRRMLVVNPQRLYWNR